jgi:DNA-binding protein Fis
MNPGKATPIYQRTPDARGYLKPALVQGGLNQSKESQAPEFARESSAQKNRLAQNVRLKLLKVLTLTLLRELEGVEVEPGHQPAQAFDLQSEVQHFEAELIRSALIMTGGRQRRAAKLLGMKVTTLHTKIRRYGLCDAGLKPDSDHGPASGDEPTVAEAVRTSLQLVGEMLERTNPEDATPEIHVTGSN